MVLLDTHIWYWLVTGERPLESAALSRIDRAAQDNGVMIPVIAIWELGLLNQKGRIGFREPIEDWVFTSLALPGIRLADLTPEIALLCNRLPGPLHSDPADRIIVATAIERAATLVTRDKALLSYGAEGHVKVLRA